MGDPSAPFAPLDPYRPGGSLSGSYNTTLGRNALTIEATKQAADMKANPPEAAPDSLKSQVDKEIAQGRALEAAQNAAAPWAVHATDDERDLMHMDIAQAADPLAKAYEWGTALQFSKLMQIPVSTALSNLESLSQEWTGKAYVPKTTARAVADSLNAGINMVNLGTLANQWADSGGADGPMREQLRAIKTKIDSLSEDSIPRPWYIDAVKGAAQTIPYMVSGALVGAGMAAAGGLMAAAAGVEVGSGGLGTPLAVGAALGGMAVAGSAVNTFQTTKGFEYFDLREAGYSHEVAGAVASISGGIQAVIETMAGDIPGLGRLIGQGADNVLVNLVAKRVAQGGFHRQLAVGMSRFITQSAGEGVEEGLQSLSSDLGKIVASSMEEVGADVPDAKKIAQNIAEQSMAGFEASLILGMPGAGIMIKRDTQHARAIKEYAKTTIDAGLTKPQFSDQMRALKEMDEYEPETRDKIINGLWDQASKERTKAIAKDEAQKAKDISSLPDIGDEEGTGKVNRLPDKRLYVQEKTVTDSEDGEVRKILKLGDPSTKGKYTKRYGTIEYREESGAINVEKLSGKMDEETKKDFILELMARNPGKPINWTPTTPEDRQIKEDLIARNPRGAEAGLQWFGSKDEAPTTINREAVRAKILLEGDRMGLKTAEQKDFAVDLFDKTAKSIGLSTDEYLSAAFTPEAMVTDRAPPGAAQQDYRGATSRSPIGDMVKSTMYFAEKADFTTFVHESTHAYVNVLKQIAPKNAQASAQLARIESALGVKGGDWAAVEQSDWAQDYLEKAQARGINLSKEEVFAYAFEDYLRTGKAPTPETASIFRKVAQWFMDVYQSVVKRVKVNPEISRIFDELILGDTSGIAQEARRAEEAPARAQEEELFYQDENPDDFFEKRNLELRDKLVRDMTDEEKAIALLTHEISFIPNRRAYHEDIRLNGGKPYPIQGSLDVDGLKWVNDNMGHRAGDTLLRRVGAELVKVAAEHNFYVYHEHGDEFILQGNNLDDVLKGLNDIDNRLKSAILEEEEYTNGSKLVLTGLGLSAGIDDQGGLKDADRRLYDEKSFREGTGERAHHGTQPSGLSVLRESGETDDANAAAGILAERGRAREALAGTKKPDENDGLSPENIRKKRLALLFQDARSVETIVYKFPSSLKAYSDIHSQAQVSGILNIFGRGVIDAKGDIRLGDAGSSHVGLASGMTDARRFYFGYSRDKQAVYMVAKNGMDEAFLRKPEVLKAVLSQVFDKYRLNVAQGKRLGFTETLFQAEIEDVRSKYEGTDAWMKAPNNKPTNLNENQWLQVRTGSFKKWFGDWEADQEHSSKVVDDNGEPLVVYHGTEQGTFDVFSLEKAKDTGQYGKSFYFTENKEMADQYGKNNEYGRTIPVFLNGRYGIAEKRADRAAGREVRETDYIKPMDRDGNRDRGIWVVKNPNQIKSAISNVGTFDAQNPSIFFQADIDTPEFKKWFGDSKVIDSDGAPLVVYHGTPEGGFDQFDIERRGTRTLGKQDDSRAFHFTDSKDTAIAYSEEYLNSKEGYIDYKVNGESKRLKIEAKNPRPNAQTYSVYLSAQNPLVVEKSEYITADIIQKAKDRGHDSIFSNMGTGKEYVVFSPTQIKSVNNRGAWDSTDPRILFQPAYHGSPHDFDRFTTEKMGSGEGNQAYGWGLYFAGEKDVAEWYRKKLSRVNDKLMMDGKTPTNEDYYKMNDVDQLIFRAWNSNPKDSRSIKEIIGELKNGKKGAFKEWKERYQQAIDKVLSGAITIEEDPGQLYKVDIPADEEYLDWDKKIGKQNDRIKKILTDADYKGDEVLKAWMKNGAAERVTTQGFYERLAEKMPGENNQEKIKQASLYLKSIGIPGIRYLNATGRNGGGGSYNYVIFDEADVKIEETYFQDDIPDNVVEVARDFDSWEKFMSAYEDWLKPDDSITNDMTEDEKKEWYKAVWEFAQEKTGQETIDNTREDERLAEAVKTDEGLYDFLVGLYRAGIDYEYINAMKHEGPEDAESAARFEQLGRSEAQIKKSASPRTMAAIIRAGHNKELSQEHKAQARTNILNNLREYRRLAAMATGDAAMLKAIDEDTGSMPYIQDPKWVAAAETLSIQQRKKLAAQITNEILAKKIVRGEVQIDDPEVKDHLKWLNEQIKEAEVKEKALETDLETLSDELSDTQKAALKKIKTLKEYEAELSRVEKQLAGYIETRNKKKPETEQEKARLEREITILKRQAGNARKASGPNNAKLLSALSALDARARERTRRQGIEAERRAVKDLKLQMEALAKKATKNVPKNVDRMYANVIEKLQKGLDPAFRSKKTLEWIESLKKKIENNPDMAPYLPSYITDRIEAKPLNEWTLAELKDFTDRILHLKEAGQTIFEAKKANEKRAREAGATSMMNAILAGEPLRRSKGKPKPMNAWNKIKLATIRPLLLFREMDGGKRGPVTEWFWDKLNEAMTKTSKAVRERQDKMLKRIDELGFTLDPMNKKKRYLGAEVDILIDGTPMRYDNGRKPTLQEVIFWSIGVKNEKTERALIAGNGLSAVEMYAGIKTLQAEDLALGEAIQEDFDDNFDRLAEAFRMAYNANLPQEEHYIPMRRQEVSFDTRSEEVGAALTNGFGQTKKFKDKGFTKGRKEITDDYQTPIRTDLVTLWFEQVKKEEGFIYEDLIIKELQDIANKPMLQRSIQQKYGPGVKKWLQKYINDAAAGSAFQAMTGTEKFMQLVRGNLAISYLSFNLLSNFKQITGPLLYLGESRPQYLLSAAGKYLVAKRKKGADGHLIDNSFIREIEEKSEAFRTRSISAEFEEFKRMEAAENAPAWLKSLIRFNKKTGGLGMKSLEAIDHVTVAIGWRAVYDSAIAKGMTEAEAVRQADDSTAITQPSGRVQDMAEIYRSGDTMKFFTMFTNALNAQWNMLAYRVPQAIKNKEFAAAAGNIGALALAGIALALISGAAHGDDDEEKKKKLIYGVFSQYLDSLPLIGAAAGNFAKTAVGLPTYTPSGVDIFPYAKNFTSALSNIKQADYDDAVYQAAQGLGFMLGLPVSGPKKMVDALIEQKPELMIGWRD